ncbi:ABC transporter permease [Novosphingobium sp. PP1Y]|uniref:ABC transporter permease n=1 Tax=Novosphingobium sp. PP1Y TaxID=702113 RepID=UPI0002DA128F|nr:ABC transporter permease [Novosphingobium sp. PP1Y]
MATAFADVEPKGMAQAQSENAVTQAATEPAASESKAEKAAPAAVLAKVQDVIAKFGKGLIAPILGIAAFLAIWAALAPQVDTSLGALPGPLEVAEQGVALYDEWQAANVAKAEFYEAQEGRIAAGTQAVAFNYAGPPTFLDQVLTSLKTVALGFILATVFAVPIGLAAGLSPMFNAAINPLVQIMKPVSPLAWLPIVTMVVSATVSSADPMLAKSFVISAIVVMLCSLWPTLINTAIGSASIDKDLLNVGRVLKLGWFAKLTRLVLPSSLPYIFTGMRLSLGVGWMVLIAAEMLAQNPGLGKFVWDEFQNGSSQSLARIMFAVIVIGLIGFLLDRIMMMLQSLANRNHTI